MTILFISQSAPPKNSPESIQTGRYIQQLSKNHQVILLTTQVRGGWEPEDETLRKYLANVYRIITFRMPHPKVISLIQKIAPFILVPDEGVFFIWQLRRALRKISQPIDVIVSRSAPFSSAVLSMRLSKHVNAPWIMHMSDPWADNPFFHGSHLAKNRISKMESECIGRANLVTLTSFKTVDFFRAKYPFHSDKFMFLPNVFDAGTINTLPVEFQRKMKWVFTGRLYGNRRIHEFLNAVEEATQEWPMLEDKCEFIFAGFFDANNLNRIKESFLKNITYLGPLDQQKAIELQQSASVLIVIDSLSSDSIFELFFPSKLLDYFAAKRRIVAVTGKDSTTFDLIENKLGKCFTRENLSELPAHIVNMVESYSQARTEDFEVNFDFMEYSAQRNSFRLEQEMEKLISHK